MEDDVELDIYGDLGEVAPAPNSTEVSAPGVDNALDDVETEAASSSDEEDVPDVLFEQVTASSTPVDGAAQARKRRHTPGLARLEPPLFLGPPPHLALHAPSPENYLAVSGLNWWLSDAKLRQKAEQAAPCRHVRILDRADNGRSHGIGIFEFTTAEGAQKALYSLPEILRINGLTLHPISTEFLAEARRTTHLGPSWLEGGPITQDLCSAMQNLFGISLCVKPIANRPPVKIKPKEPVEIPYHLTAPKSSPPKNMNDWESKLKRLKQSVNKKAALDNADQSKYRR